MTKKSDTTGIIGTFDDAEVPEIEIGGVFPWEVVNDVLRGAICQTAARHGLSEE